MLALFCNCIFDVVVLSYQPVMMASMLAVADEVLEPEVELDEELEAKVGGSSEERAALSPVGEAEEVG